jgi:hypothetical protein
MERETQCSAVQVQRRCFPQLIFKQACSQLTACPSLHSNQLSVFGKKERLLSYFYLLSSVSTVRTYQKIQVLLNQEKDIKYKRMSNRTPPVNQSKQNGEA